MKKTAAFLMAGLVLLLALSGCVARRPAASSSTPTARVHTYSGTRSVAESTFGAAGGSSVLPATNSAAAAPANNSVKPEVYLAEGTQPHATCTENLNLRTGPGTDYDVILIMPQYDSVVELGYTPSMPDWVYVEHLATGNEGWAVTEYLDYGGGGMAKPVIYLYPEKTTDVLVTVEFENGHFTCTYPEYNDGWDVTAYPDGHLINKADGREYSYLYWEGAGDAAYDMSRGFVVKGGETAAFLQEKLATMGLTPREYNEFIVYWLPLMQNNPYNLITFQTTAYTDNVHLSVTPQPDSMLRIFMVYQPLEKPVALPAQTLPTFARTGFAVVEWGGTSLSAGTWG